MSFLEAVWRSQEEPEPYYALTSQGDESLLGSSLLGHDCRYIARQAILTHDLSVFGYELLCRTGWENRFLGDSDTATRQMITDGALYGFDQLTSGALPFVNCTREALVERLVTVLPVHTILEVLETVVPDSELLDALREIKQLGYRIALDDFRMSPALEPLLHLADFIKVDLRISDLAERQQLFAALRQHPNVQLIAEKVETRQEFETALAEGFQLFQGYFFAHPTVFSRRANPANGPIYLHLLSTLSDTTQAPFQIARIVSLIRDELIRLYEESLESADHATGHQQQPS